tara:strand:- start:56 stop:202 length:147 start_codon:yes stop_codon:yes gene_type:complete
MLTEARAQIRIMLALIIDSGIGLVIWLYWENDEEDSFVGFGAVSECAV